VSPRQEKAPIKAAAGTIAMAAGLTDRILASPLRSSGVRIKVASIHMAPPMLMTKNATAKTLWV
jgi:hypothetical protein